MVAPDASTGGGVESTRGLQLLDLLVLLPTALLLVALATTGGGESGPSHVERIFVLWISFCLLLFAGTRLGLALPAGTTGRDVAAAGSALCLAMAANLLTQPAIAIALLAVAHAAQGAWDATGIGGMMPDDYGRRRMRQTFGMVAMLIVAIFLAA